MHIYIWHVYDYKNYFNSIILCVCINLIEKCRFYSVIFFNQVRIKALLFQMKNSMTIQIIRAKQQHILDEFNLYTSNVCITTYNI